MLPILEETSDAGKLRHAYVALQTRPRDLEDTLARVLYDDDPVFAAAAVHFIVQRRLWALTGDIEYVLGHRSADGHAAVEAASWALRIRRAGRPSASEPLTIVELAHRVRTIPLFEFVSVDELFRVAAAGEEARHPAGRELFHPGAAPDHMEFLIEGAVRMIQPSGTTSEIEAPAVLGLEDVLQGAPPTVTIRAVEPVVCFRIGAGEFMTMVSGNALLAQSLFQMLLARATWQDAKPPLLTRATPPQLRALIEVAAEVPMTEGTVLVEQGDAPAVFQVVDGELRLETAGGATVVLPGMTLGVADTLSGSAASARAVVTRSGRALRVDRDDLFAVLTDHMDLMQGVFSEVLALPRKELPGIAAQA